MTYKTIFSGRLEFGSARSFSKVYKMFEHRVENYYKNDILIDGEEAFLEEETALSIPRLITQSSDKSWRNTINLMEYLAQFAVAGGMSAWRVDNGKVLQHNDIEPKSDKAAVQAFLMGRELIKESGKETEAKAALSRAIEKFERHALAYERRGYVNFQLCNLEDAMYDYSKSIDINPGIAAPYYGRAFVRMAQEEFAGAVTDFEKAIKKSLPLQPIYWRARRTKGDCHLKMEEYDKALFEYRLFLKRGFAEDHPNFKWLKRTHFNLGKALIATGAFDEAVEAFNNAMAFEGEGNEPVAKADQLFYRGLAMKKAGQEAFVQDLTQAANLGSKRAADLLAEVA